MVKYSRFVGQTRRTLRVAENAKRVVLTPLRNNFGLGRDFIAAMLMTAFTARSHKNLFENATIVTS